ncbi:Hypothetical protein, putative [Bodo saltans]|uniref:Uncharacterized protein n=1 Tax=Bodo saltans TaxID=75058 RepID=A0A0S4JI89_BODSA|nr:Hypothetical protein, putative [Bodo saltans]|eukprot:CUG89638.1 Hypothetical protein, putative [Bodo saltans]
MFNPFDSAFVSTNDKDVSQVASVKSPTTAGNDTAARFPSTVAGHEQSKYERIVGGGGVLSATDDGVTVGLYIPKPFFGPHNDDHSIVAAHGWKATFDTAKGKLYFSKLSDKSQRCWTLPAYEAATTKSAVKGTTKKTTAKKPASSKKKPSTKKKSTKQASDAATSEASEQRGDDEDEEEEDEGDNRDNHYENASSSHTKPYGGDSYLRSASDNPYDDGDDDVFSRFSASNAAARHSDDPFLQSADPSLFAAGGGNVYDEDPFSMYHTQEQQEQQPLQHGGDTKYSVAAHHVVAEKPVPAAPAASAMMSRDPSSSDSNGDEENATGVFRDDAHRSLSGRHLENASSQDIPDDAVPPLSSPMPQHLQHGGGMNTSTTALPQSHVTLSSTQQQLSLCNNNCNSNNSQRTSDDYYLPYAHNRDDSTDAGYERSVPPSSSSNAVAQMEVNPQLAWLIHELDMLPDDEESAREDILLIESSDRDILAYEAAAEVKDVRFNIGNTATSVPKPEASPNPSSSPAVVTTSEVVGVLAAMIVDEADKFRRKEDAVQSELAVLIQKKSLDDRFLQSNSSSDATSPPAKRTALEELLLATSSPGSTEASPPQEPYAVDSANYSNSPGHQHDQAPPIVCRRHEEVDDEENGFAPFPSFSQTSSATFAPAQGDDDGEAEHQQEVGSPVLRDEDFPTSSLAKHIRSDSIYIAHHSDDRRDYVKEGIEHPEEHHVVPSIVGRRSSASVELVGESPSSASVARRRRVSLDVNVASPSGDTLDDRASDDAGQLHATFVSSADLRGLSKYQPGYTDDSNDDGPASSPMLRDDDFPTSTLAKHLRKDSIYVARHHREHQDFVKEGMENPEEHHHIASLSSSGAALSMSGGASASSSRHRRTSVNDGLDFDIDDGSVSNNNASGLRPSFVSSADLKGLSSYNNATNNDHRHHLEYNDGAASPMLRDEDFPTSALARHVRNDSIYFH